MVNIKQPSLQLVIPIPHNKNYENIPKFYKQKGTHAPNTLGVTIILVTKIFQQDMSSKSKHKKFNIISLKKVEIGRSLSI